MKKVLFLIGVVITVSSCKSTVSTTSGLENNAHIKVVKANYSESYEQPLTLIIDDQEFQISEIYTDKKSMKASVIPTTPGKHHVVIKDGQKVIYDKSIFIDNRETRKIILE
jgi:hypothetical protein